VNAEGKYKLLDCNRKDILGLPSGAVHLWLTYYMNESEGGESWLSLRKIEIITGMVKNTIIKWQRYLLEHGWLVETGETAGDKYTNPTNGSWKVPVLRVDHPKGGSKNEPTKNCTKGSGYGSASGLDSAFDSRSSSTSVGTDGLTSKDKTLKPTTKTNSKTKTCKQCGNPLPSDRPCPCYTHRGVAPKPPAGLSAPAPRGNDVAPATPPKPAPPPDECPVCREDWDYCVCIPEPPKAAAQ
jgi:hypothetical protein